MTNLYSKNLNEYYRALREAQANSVYGERTARRVSSWYPTRGTSAGIKRHPEHRAIGQASARMAAQRDRDTAIVCGVLAVLCIIGALLY